MTCIGYCFFCCCPIGLLHYLLFAWKFMKASVEASTASMETSIASMKASIASMEKKCRKLPRKCFHGSFHGFEIFHEIFLGFSGLSSMESSGSFDGRSEAWRLPRKLLRKFFMKAFEVASTKVESYIHRILRFASMEASAASTESQRLPRQLPRIYLYCRLLYLQ